MNRDMNQDGAKADVHSNTVIIIGGGVAGLTAANHLKRSGVPVVILEGRDRLGGRIHTVDLAGDQRSWTDMGAAWIDDHLTNRVYHLLNDAGVGVESTKMGLFGHQIYDQKSSRWSSKAATAWTTAKFGWRLSKLQKESTEFANLGERFTAMLGEQPKRVDEYLLTFFPELLNGGPGGDVHPNVGAKNYWEFLTYEEKTSVMITGGYRHLVDDLAKSLSDGEVLLNHPVTKISIPPNDATRDETDGPSAVVETSRGETFEGSHVIVTVPLGVLKAETITFDPPLPARKQDAIRRIGFGHVEKVTMSFRTAFWRRNAKKTDHVFSIPDPLAAHGMFVDVTDVAGSSPGMPASPCLAYICGSDTATWAATNPEEAANRAADELEVMFPNSFEQPVATATSTWSSSPFSRGCYAYPSVDTRPGDFTTLGEPTHGGHVLFAGDACADGTYLANVEGALVSGERAADAVLVARPGTIAGD